MTNPNMKDAVKDVLIERIRQTDRLGYTPEHDDRHTDGALAAYAALLAVPPDVLASFPDIVEAGLPARCYLDDILNAHRWQSSATDRRTKLVQAAALLLAEIDRLDRLEERDA